MATIDAGAYHVRATLGLVGARYSFTDDALANLRLFGVTPGGRVIRHLGDDVLVVYAVARRGKHLAVLLAEADHGDNDWDILSARDLSETEIKRYSEALRS
jgi:hypothetical protein